MTDHTQQEREIYGLVFAVKNAAKYALDYANAPDIARPLTTAELKVILNSLINICGYCLQHNDNKPINIILDSAEPWLLAAWETNNEATRSLLFEISDMFSEAQKIVQDTPTATDKLPLTSNKITTAEAATALLSELITRGYIAQANSVQAHGAQVETWLYLWNFASRPEQITPLNWVENLGLLGVMMGEIAHRGKIHEAAAWAFVGKGKTLTARRLNSATSNIKNQPSRRGDARRVELENLIKTYTNG